MKAENIAELMTVLDSLDEYKPLIPVVSKKIADAIRLLAPIFEEFMRWTLKEKMALIKICEAEGFSREHAIMIVNNMQGELNKATQSIGRR